MLLAVPSAAISDAHESVQGLEGKTLIDATNLVQGERPGGLDSLSAYVKQLTGAHVAKAFNTVFARLYDQVSEQRATGEGKLLDGGQQPSCVSRAAQKIRGLSHRFVVIERQQHN